MLTVIPIVGWSGLGPDINLALYYNSGDTVWRTSYSQHLIDVSALVKVYVRDDGRQIDFTKSAGVWVAEAGFFLELEEDQPSDTWTITTKDQWRLEFLDDQVNDEFLLQKIIDSAGNELTITQGTGGRIEEVEDAVGRKLVFHYAGGTPDGCDTCILGSPPSSWTCSTDVPVGALACVTDVIGRYFRFAYDGEDRLITVYDAMNYRIDFEYAGTGSRGLAKIWDKNQYEAAPAEAFKYEYSGMRRIIKVIDPDPAAGLPLDQEIQYVTQFNSHSTLYTDRRGNRWGYFYNTDRELTGKNNPFFTREDFEYDTDRNLTLYHDGVDNEWTWTYDDRGNMLTATDPIGALPPEYHEAYEYWSDLEDPRTRNNLTKYTDQEGNVWQYAYDDPTTDPTVPTQITLPPAQGGGPAGLVTLTYYDAEDNDGGPGQLESVTGPNGVLTTFEYDQYGQFTSEVEGPNDPTMWQVRIDAIANEVGWVEWDQRSGAMGGSTLLIGGGPPPVYIRNPNGDLIAAECPIVVPPLCGPECDGSNGAPVCPPFGSEPDLQDVNNMQYDKMGRLTSSQSDIFCTLQGEQSEAQTWNYLDELGRLTIYGRGTDEPDEPLNPTIGKIVRYNYEDWDQGIVRRCETGADGNAYTQTTTTNDAAGRVTSVVRESCLWTCYCAEPTTLFTVTYAYYNDLDLLESVVYSNGTRIEYQYNAAHRLTRIKHLLPGPSVLLQLDYTYTDRGLIEEITETDENSNVSTITFGYDDRGRLTSECRTGTHLYDLAYTYDQGGNRLTKTNAMTNYETTYYYDVHPEDIPDELLDDPPNPPLHFANRLVGYEIRTIPVGTLRERVRYFYALDGHAAGNVYRIERDSVSVPGQAWCFTYNRAGEIWMITEQSWPIGQPENATVDRVVELRGKGRQRYLIRDRDTLSLEPDAASAIWTNYDESDLPFVDFAYDGGMTVTTRYILGLAQTDEATGENSFVHTNHLGTSRAMTDDLGASQTTFVFTAFGERVDSNGFVTRYAYVGSQGYEAFDPPIGAFMHVGARWYDPETGRFLQRDPIGMNGLVNPRDVMGISKGVHLYVYVAAIPTQAIDPLGEFQIFGFEFNAEWASNLLADLGRGAAATADGFIPLIDPFDSLYDTNKDPGTKWSKRGGKFAYLCIQGPRSLSNAKNLINRVRSPNPPSYVPIRWPNMQTPHPLKQIGWLNQRLPENGCGLGDECELWERLQKAVLFGDALG